MRRLILPLVALLIGAGFVVVGFRASGNVANWALSRPPVAAIQPPQAARENVSVTINKGENARTIGEGRWGRLRYVRVVQRTMGDLWFQLTSREWSIRAGREVEVEST